MPDNRSLAEKLEAVLDPKSGATEGERTNARAHLERIRGEVTERAFPIYRPQWIPQFDDTPYPSGSMSSASTQAMAAMLARERNARAACERDGHQFNAWIGAVGARMCRRCKSWETR